MNDLRNAIQDILRDGLQREGEEKLGPDWRVDFITPERCRRGYLGLRHKDGFALVRSKIPQRLALEQLEREPDGTFLVSDYRKARRQPWWRLVDAEGRLIAGFGGPSDVACAQAERIMSKALPPGPSEADRTQGRSHDRPR